MTFGSLAPGDSVFLDANTLVYHFEPHPTFGPACNQLIARIENQEIHGFTSTHILTEVAHRLMILEASLLPGWKSTKIKNRLQKQPAVLQTLTQFPKPIATVLNSQIHVLRIEPPLILTATAISQTAGLLSNDALLVAVMQQNGLTRLASTDSDFDRAPGIIRYAPI